MKKIFLLLCLCVSVFAAKSQDLIVTNEGDSISCKITRISDEFIHFSVFDSNSGVLLMRSRLPRSSVSFFEQRTKEDELLVSKEDPDLSGLAINYEQIDPPSFRLAINGGFTYQFGGYDGAPQSYKDQVQTLWNLESELHYFPIENVGIGAKYNYIFTPAEEDFFTNSGILRLRDELIRFQFLAFSVSYRNLLSDEQIIYYSFSAGRVDYRTDLTLNGADVYELGNTLGVSFGLKYDFLLSDNVGVGVGAEVLLAKLEEIERGGGTIPVDFDISRIDLTVGLRFFK